MVGPIVNLDCHRYSICSVFCTRAVYSLRSDYRIIILPA